MGISSDDGSDARGGSGDGGGFPGRRSLQAIITGDVTKTFLTEALVGLWQSAYVENIQSRRDGPAMIWTTALNVSGGSTFRWVYWPKP